MAVMNVKPTTAILQKLYVYDPGLHAGDEFGGLRVIKDEKEGDALHVLASRTQMQYWIDQGLAGQDPPNRLSGAGQKLLSQITRGRSEDPDADPVAVPRYSRATQSGAPQFAATASALGQRQKQVKQDRQKKPKKMQKEPPSQNDGTA